MHPKDPASTTRVTWAYVGGCVLAWLLHILANLDTQRGTWSAWEAIYQATWALWPAALLGALLFPWVRWLDARALSLPALVAAHTGAALLFGAAWQLLDFAGLWLAFGPEHAGANLRKALLSREIVGLVVYAGIAIGFTAVLQARRARAGLIAAAQAEADLARAELAAITGKLNPHFLFNTLNSVIVLTRKDPQRAEQALHQFSDMLRYVLATQREAKDRVSLQDELDFVRNYLALESLRLGPRLQVDWSLDPDTLQDEVPPLTLQPLVENAIVHGVAPRKQGGRVGIVSERDAAEGVLHLCVQDDGAGCDPSKLDAAEGRSGIGLSALRRRFALDFGGRARMSISTAPDAGFRVDLWIPQPA
ncbi:sensor histidine kinase [Ramlibacter albus]|uniref:Histidine kinase n=1 Tax=Ramlibacter albus TaxID=2079448 RepID=A0A923M8A0_9BURK|nr:histidine kinase [Ramlibacter albus]MBC5764604.1 histidine kinase [Ramlibacter albus]